MKKKTSEKQMTHKTLLISFDGSSVERVIQEIKDTESRIIALGGSDISVDLTTESYAYESREYPRMEFSYRILETDKELQNRIESEKATVEYRRKQFEQLQKEFGA
jgi:hypothetical protein